MHAFTNGVTLKTAGPQTVTATDSVTSTITGNQTVTISAAAAASMTLTGLTAGTAGMTQTATVSAVDQYNNVAKGYTGTVHFTSSDGQAVLPADYTFLAADNGSRGFPVTLKTAGSQSVTVTDTVTATLTATQSGLVISPAGAATLQVIGLTPAVAGTAQTPTVTAIDAFNNRATAYTGTVHFTSSDSQATLPANYTFLVTDGGMHAFTAGVTLKTAGPQTVTATDTGTASIPEPDGNHHATGGHPHHPDWSGGSRSRCCADRDGNGKRPVRQHRPDVHGNRHLQWQRQPQRGASS